jgi:cyclophilin family peptidyl-prolyl cis-trans isomerase
MFPRLLFTASFACLGAACFAAVPVIDDPVPVDDNGKPAHVGPVVPIGKSLILPITASADGDMLRYTVTSSSPTISVRAHTGQPHLKFAISHAGDGTAADPAFSGEIEFALLKDLTPVTSAYIAGFAQGHFYDGQIFHRIANLDPSVARGFIFQGGDPHGDGTGGPGETGGLAGTGFKFENEFQAPLIFAGRGQLAMANSGSNSSSFKGTNGSQFFITEGSPRFLDFRHTIFGQVLRGWELLPKLAAVPRHPAPVTDTDPPQDKPKVDVKLETARVVPNFTDAWLEISATAPGAAIITVTVNDGSNAPVSRAFTVVAYEDTRNTPAFLTPEPSQFVGLGVVTSIPLKAVDLESDYLFYGETVRSGSGVTNPNYNPALIRGDGVGALNLGVTVTPYDMTARPTIDGLPGPSDRISVPVAVGDKRILTKAVSFTTAPGVGLVSQVVGTYVDSDPRGSIADFTASVNWGDGTPLTNGIVGRDLTTPGRAHYQVTASHTYPYEGTFSVLVEFTGNKGAKARLRSTAIVSSAPITAVGTVFKVTSATATNRVVATFSDAAPGQPSDYSAQVSWGDGRISDGQIRRTPEGVFQVVGSHTFLDPENFAIGVRVRKTALGSASDTFASGLALTSGFTGAKHRPPYAVPHLVGAFGNSITRLPGSESDVAGFSPPVRTVTGSGANLQAFISCQLLVINAGKKASQPGKLQFFLSADKTLNRTAKEVDDPNNPGQTYVTPADRPVLIGTIANGNLQSFAPGQVALFSFRVNATGDDRLVLPKGENGSSFNLLAHFEYSDPLANNMPIGHDVIFGPINGFNVTASSLVVQEGSTTIGSKTFNVTMDRKPTANVTVNFSASDATQVDVSPASHQLVFTPQDFDNPFSHTVVVTAKDDGPGDGTKNVFITLAPAVSADRQWNGINPSDVFVTVLDKANTP